MKPISDARTCKDGCTYLRGQMLNEAFPANVCGNGCNALQGRLQTFAGTVAMLCRGKTGAEIVSPILDERKGGSIRVTIVPRKILLSGQKPR